MLAFFTNLIKSCGISGQIFGLVSSFLNDRWLQVVLDGESSQEYPVNLVLHFSYYILMTFLMMLSVIIAIYADDNTL